MSKVKIVYDLPEHEIDSSTDLAIERTEMALERTHLAWIRTVIAMISSGFSIDKLVEVFHH